MLDNNSINIGGVRFNKNDVQKSEVIKQDGKEMNSVFLNDGTQVVYPNQKAENDASIMQTFGKKSEWVPNDRPNNAAYKSVTVEDQSYKETTFNKLENAQITGTKGKDDYKLNDCKDTHVDISQDDGVKDNVFANKNSTGITVDKADGDKAKIKNKN